MPSLMDANSTQEALRILFRPSSGLSRLSAATYSKKLGYKSPRLIEMILKGDRSPSADFLSRTAQFFSLAETEHLYLELLSQKEKMAALGRSTEVWDRRIKELKRKIVSMKFLEPHFFTLVADWYCLVIKQLLQVSGKGLNSAEITKKLRGKVTITETEKALHALMHLGFIQREEGSDAFISINKDPIYTRPDLPSHSVRKHHRQMMERAIEALEEQGLDEREMISLTLACSRASIPKLKAALRRFRDEINAEYSDPEGSHIYQLNFQLFAHNTKD